MSAGAFPRVRGVRESAMQTVGDLQGGLEEAERLVGYRVVSEDDLLGVPDA